jgi:divinyl protochlorophyllide a 8-vinyl-reductase
VAGVMEDGMGTARIGPNAVTRLAEALVARHGQRLVYLVFAKAGQLGLLRTPPASMVEEPVVTALHASLRRHLLPMEAAQIAAEAGRLTADYLLANRIPRPVQWLLRGLPAPLAARVLVGAIRRHAWTFAGSGRFAARFAGRLAGLFQRRGLRAPLYLSITGCPICQGERSVLPVCDYYAATFQRLFRELVSPRTVVVETCCEASGATHCGFEVRW